jgi:hypothetical protein
MRAICLYGLSDLASATAYFDSTLSIEGERRWSLADGDRTYAWLEIELQPEIYIDERNESIPRGPCVVADLSGRAPDRKDDLVAYLKIVRSVAGGILYDDKGAV